MKIVNEKKIWCSFSNDRECHNINANSVLSCWKKLKKDFPDFNTNTINCVDIIWRDLTETSGHNDCEALALSLEEFKNGLTNLKKGK
jgi:hypothetical protein